MVTQPNRKASYLQLPKGQRICHLQPKKQIPSPRGQLASLRNSSSLLKSLSRKISSRNSLDAPSEIRKPNCKAVHRKLAFLELRSRWENVTTCLYTVYYKCLLDQLNAGIAGQDPLSSLQISSNIDSITEWLFSYRCGSKVDVHMFQLPKMIRTTRMTQNDVSFVIFFQAFRNVPSRQKSESKLETRRQTRQDYLTISIRTQDMIFEVTVFHV